MTKKRYLSALIIIAVFLCGASLTAFLMKAAYAQEKPQHGRVLYVAKWDIHPDKVDAYMEWTKTAIPQTLAVPGLIEFRAYRPATGASQIVVTYEFADLAAWASWYDHEESQKLRNEGRPFMMNVSAELWGPSPVVPEPIRPGQ
jgi:quinol monooxygenase YgiN